MFNREEDETVDAVAEEPIRVRLKTSNPYAPEMLGTVVDSGMNGYVVNWDNGTLLSYVTFDAVELAE